MSGEGGLSVGQVQSIVAGMLSPLERELGQHARAISAMEDEMGRVADAMHGMTRELAGRLENLRAGQSEMVHLQRSTQEITLDQFQRANLQLVSIQAESVAGFTQVRGGLGEVSQDVRLVDGSVQQMSRAVVQMEVIRVLNEAREPVERVRTFTEEIDQRFAKAIENVHFVRSQYDQMLATAMGEYDNKLRAIGEHIFATYEQDFRAWAEEPLTTSPEAKLDLAMAVDERRIEARAEALEASLDEVGSARLDPLLNAHREFEHALASRFATKLDAEGDVAVPMAARVYQDPSLRLDVLGQVEVGASPEGFTLTATRDLSELGEALRGRATAVGRGMSLRKLSAQEISRVKEALAALSAAGTFDGEMLQGYFDYLDTFGLEVIVDEGGAR